VCAFSGETVIHVDVNTNGNKRTHETQIFTKEKYIYMYICIYIQSSVTNTYEKDVNIHVQKKKCTEENNVRNEYEP